jgi:glycosyltransferase involved in cell wall biosynthesis
MKVCIVLSNSTIAHRSFYNSQEVGLAKTLIKLGVSVDICTYSKKRGGKINALLLETHEGHDIRLLEYDGLSFPGQQAFSLTLLQYLWKNTARYDLIQLHDNTQIMTVLSAWVCKKIKIPCLLYQGMYRDWDAWWKKVLLNIYDVLFMRVLFASLSAVIGKTESALEYLRSKGMPAWIPAKVIHVGLDTTVFSPGNSNRHEKRTAAEYDVLYIGKLEKRRRPDFLAELLLALSRLKKDFKACVVGDGPDREAFIKKIKGLIDSGHVRYIPKVENKNLIGIYRKSRVFLNPTKYEIFGMGLMEAMYFGVPVIATAEAGPKEIISDGTDGILLEGFDLSVWEHAVMDLLDHEKNRVQMGRRAGAKIEEKFVWEHIAPKFYETYALLCAGKIEEPAKEKDVIQLL